MSELFERFSPLLLSVLEADIQKDPTLQGRLSIYKETSLSIFYAPFEHIETSAKVVVIGITPGLQQATNALLEARRQLIAGKSNIDALAAAKVFASFSGPMRTNLIAMLDFIGLHKWAGVTSMACLWDTHRILRISHQLSATLFC